MYISKINIKNFRAFSTLLTGTDIELGENITCISGHNGIGKSTILALLSNTGEIKTSQGTHLNGNPFRGEYSTLVKGDKNFDTSGEKCTIYFNDIPSQQNPNNPFVEKLSFRATFQKKSSSGKSYTKINALDYTKMNLICMAKNILADVYSIEKMPDTLIKEEQKFTELILECFDNSPESYYAEINEIVQDYFECLFNDAEDFQSFVIVYSDQIKDFVKGSYFFYKEIYDEVTTSVKQDRYRLIPIPSDERTTEKKIEWPTYYLGLSRLFPVGEAEQTEMKKIKPEIMENIFKIHQDILNSPDIGTSASSVKINNLSSKSGFGITTEKYGSLANSSGQDNLGQILLTIASFEQLKEKQGDDYYGGIFLIDELDATLHPAAQRKLFDYLYKCSRKLNLQIVFTTHSLSLIEHIIKTGNLSNKNNRLKLIYLSNARGEIECKTNPDLTFINNDMLLTYNGINNSTCIQIITEDSIARWFLTKILQSSEKKYNYKFLEASLGWPQILDIIKSDYSYYQNSITVLDPDVKNEDIYSQIAENIKSTRYKFMAESNENTTKILSLPGLAPIEKIMWEYISAFDETDKFYFDKRSESLQLNKRAVLQNGPLNNPIYKSADNELKAIKRWAEDHKDILDITIDYWINENHSEVKLFLEEFDIEYNKVLKKLNNRIL